MKTIFIFALLLSKIVFAQQISVHVYNMTSFTATTSSAQAVAFNPNRSYLLIQNLGAQSVIVKFNSVQTAGEGIVIPAGGSYEPIKAPRDSIYMESASSTDNVTILEAQ